MKRVFGYLRVSGKGQLDGDGFDRQRDAIEKFCELKGFFVARWFEEKAVSGTVEAMDRPAFGEMLALAGEQFDTIVVERADRLARDLIVSELLFEEARKLNVKIFEAASGEELVNADSDPTRKLIRQVLGALAEWSKNEIVKKLRAARQRIRNSKGRCEGRVSWEELNPANRKVAGMIVTWVEFGVDEAMTGPRKTSFAAIARYLSYQEVPSPGGLDKKWSRSNVFDVYNRMIEKSRKPKHHPTGGDARLIPSGIVGLVVPQPRL